MKCDRCDNPATVHEVTIEGGKRIEKHLCESCAQKEGLSPVVSAPLASLAKFIVAQPGQVVRAADPECPRCGLKWGEFRQHGLLGCPGCYQAFEAQLAPLLERAQEGASEHVGKTPRRAGKGVARQQEIKRLRKALADALEAEQYERAAELRDALREISAADAANGDRPGASRQPGAAPREARSDAGEAEA